MGERAVSAGGASTPGLRALQDRGEGTAHEPAPGPEIGSVPGEIASRYRQSETEFRSWQTRLSRSPEAQAEFLRHEWTENGRWKGIERPYSPDDVVRLRAPALCQMDFSLARLGAEKLWDMLHQEPFIRTMGALTGNQAVQYVRAGLKAIYLSGWQVAADANLASQTYPDQSLYPSNSVPSVVARINNALLRASEIEHSEGKLSRDWLVPIVADAEAGFGGKLNAFELMKGMIIAGAAGVHFEDQLSSEKKCGHLGGKVLIPTPQAIGNLVAARLVADVLAVPTILIARTDADSAKLASSDIDPDDRKYLTGERTDEGFYRIKPGAGLQMAIERGLRFAPYSDLIWCETSHPDIGEAREFAQAIHAVCPEKMLAYNCSPSFRWSKKMSVAEAERFQDKLGELGYRFQFITLGGFHALNTSAFELASAYNERGMGAYSEFQDREIELRKKGLTASEHQTEVGVTYFDRVAQVITNGKASTTAHQGSTEEAQFQDKNRTH